LLLAGGLRRARRLLRAGQPPRGARADDPVDRQPASALEAPHRGVGPSAKAPVHRTRIDTQRAQVAL
jgi:hypothetical protein